MNPRVLLAVFVLLIASIVMGISSNDAVNFVVNSNNFLYEDEIFTPPNVALEFEETSYWVIPLIAGNNILTYFPVNTESGELSALRSTNRGLFELADNLGKLQSLKASISSNPGIDWIFTQQYQTIFNEMSLQLNDEIFQLTTVETTLDNEGLPKNLTSLKNELSAMAEETSELSAKIAAASNAENNFVTRPSLENFSDLTDSFNEVFDSISSLNEASLSYRSNVDRLKQEISVADMDTQTKSQLFSILGTPRGLQELRNYNSDSTNIRETFESSLQAAVLSRDSILDELDTRIEKNEAHKLIWGENKKIQDDTKVDSLIEAKTLIISEEKKPLWKKQSKINDLEKSYSRAVKFYNERNFEESKKNALSAIGNAVTIIKGGFEETLPPKELISQETLFQIAGVLIIILIILYLVNNRGKLSGIIDGESEEVNVYD